MEKSFLIVNHGRTKKPITCISKTGQDLALFIQLLVHSSNGNANVWVGGHQFRQSILGSNDSEDMDLWHAPLQSAVKM